MILHCHLGASRTHTSLLLDSEKPLSAIMWVKIYAGGLITYLATSSLDLMLREALIRIQVSPMRTESTWRRSVKPTLIWLSHTSYKCTTMDRLQRMWSNSKWKSTQPRSTKKRFLNIILWPTNLQIWRFTDQWIRRRISKRTTKPSFSVKSNKEDCHLFRERPSSRPSSSMKDWLLLQELMVKWDFICGSTKQMIWTHSHLLLVVKRRKNYMNMP